MNYPKPETTLIVYLIDMENSNCVHPHECADGNIAAQRSLWFKPVAAHRPEED